MHIKHFNDTRFPIVLIQFYVFAVVVGFLYSICFNCYNGDFLNYPVMAPTVVVYLNFIFSIVPFLLLKYIYTIISRTKRIRFLKVPSKFIQTFAFIIIIFHLITSLLFDVGKAESGGYSAPPFLVPIIQISLRLPYLLWGGLAVLVSHKRKTVFLYLSLIVLVSLSKGFFAIFITVFFLYFLKYPEDIRKIFKTYKVPIILLLFIIPNILSLLYNLRNELRGNNIKEEYGAIEMVAGKFIGRLSSISDSGYLLENALTFIPTTTLFDNFFFQRNMLRVFKGDLGTSITPEEILYKKGEIYNDSNSEKKSSFMLGTQGILIFSLYKSFTSFFINLITIILVIYLILNIFSKIKVFNALNFGLLLTIGPVTSGVSSEYSSVLISSILLFIIVLLYNSFKNSI